jgi:hypothetical protein
LLLGHALPAAASCCSKAGLAAGDLQCMLQA